MSLPGTDGGGVWMGDCVEAFDASKGEVVDKAYSSAVVGVEVALDDHGMLIERG